MPPKRKTPPKKARKNAQNGDLAQITKMLQKLNAPKNQVTDLGRGLLRGGNMVGSMFGFPKIFGSGSYHMATNSLWNSTSQVPIMHSATETVTIRHREYIADVSMNGTSFTSSVFSVNPGLPSTFPFLSQIGDNFQEYSFKGLVFEYKTTSATALVSGTNTAMGSVMLAAQYRADAPAFTNKSQLLNEMWSVDTVPSSNAVLPVECAPMENVLARQYTRTGPVGGDIKLFDLCTLTVATQGGQAGQTNVVGELWASYEVEFRKPQIVGGVTPTAGLGSFATSTTFSGVSPINGFANTGASTLGMTYTPNSIVFPTGLTGYYSVYIIWAGTVAGGAGSVTNPTLVNAVYANNPNVHQVPGSTASIAYAYYAVINITSAAVQATMAFPVWPVPTGTIVANMTVTPISQAPAIWA